MHYLIMKKPSEFLKATCVNEDLDWVGMSEIDIWFKQVVEFLDCKIELNVRSWSIVNKIHFRWIYQVVVKPKEYKQSYLAYFT
jgi:hypothetical protein